MYLTISDAASKATKSHQPAVASSSACSSNSADLEWALGNTYTVKPAEASRQSFATWTYKRMQYALVVDQKNLGSHQGRFVEDERREFVL